MADFLLFLGKLNLALGAAIILAGLLRRPLRAQFGAPIAYALWLLAPIAGFASLLPPRVAAPLAPLQDPAAPLSVLRQIAHPAARIAEQLTAPGPLVHPVIAARASAETYAPPDYALLLFAAWALGAVLMVLYLARLQARFQAAARLGEAGPAVLGFFRPRLVMPDAFQEQFTAPEQAAILAHERVHLGRQDARINALAALLRCLCWFNPLIHLGAHWLRIDQELACDATAVAGPVSRRDYANALLKSQMMVTALPLGCNWPGSSEHPLIERVALLKRIRPGRARRVTGAGLVMFAATCAGLGAWAAQPPVPAKIITVPHDQIALVTPQATAPAPNAADTDANQPAASNVPASKSVSDAPSPAEAQVQAASPTFQLPEQKLDLALNDATGAALANAAADASASLSDDSVARRIAANGATSASESTAALAQPGKGPRPQTEAALKCLNGLGPDGCETLFEDSLLAHRAIRYCAAEYVHDRLANCAAGALEALEYLGANAAGDDVFLTKNLDENDTYIIPPPGPDGKIPLWCTSGRPPESTFQPFCSDRHRVDSSVVKVITRPDHMMLLYTRPQDHAALQSTNPDGAFIPAAATPSNQPVAPMQIATPDPSAGPDTAVNDESISDYELRQRVALFIALYSLKPTAEDLKRIRSQVLEKMENEKTQLREAVRKHITVSPDEVDKVLNTLLAQNHITIEQLRSTLGAAGASELALRSEITAQIAWQKTVQEQHSDPANRGPAQVAATTPTSAGSDPVSPMEVLSSNGCHPIIGTVISMRSDPQLLGTDIVVDHVLPSHVVEGGLIGALDSTRRGTVVVLIPTRDVKKFPALDTYVRQEVAIWDNGLQGFHEIGMPDQLQPLSTALADPKKTLCHRLGR